jgi:hypothetical protein
MKQVIVCHKYGTSELIDNDDSDKVEYSQKLSEILTMNNVVILVTSNNVFVGRPSDISGVSVNVIDDEAGLSGIDEMQKLNDEIEKEDTKEEKDKEIVEDALVDM